MFLSIILVITPPSVSMPKDSGVTSSNSTSLISPCIIPPCIAAPTATTSSGFMSLCGSLPNKFLTASIIAGILVWPPTKITSSISEIFRPVSSTVFFVSSMDLSIKSLTKSSSLARVKAKVKCLGPEASAVRNGIFISVCIVLESSCLAFSAASLRRWTASWSLATSIPCSFLNSSIRYWIILWSMSSPPRWVSPPVPLTSIVSSETSKTEISKVPPPKS